MGRVALIGAGYTLKRVASQLDAPALVCASETKAAALRSQGYDAQALDIANSDALRGFFLQRPDISVVVDSVPPLAGPEPLRGARALATVLSEINTLQRVIYLSTTGVYGGTDGAWVNESSLLRAQHAAGIARIESEQAYRALSVEVCAYRIAAIYGPGRGIGRSLRDGNYRLISGDRWSNRIHVDDLARLIVCGIKHAGALPPVINMADDLPALSAEVVRWYCETFNLPTPPMVSLEEARSGLHHTLLSNQRVSNELLHQTFNFRFIYPSFTVGGGAEFKPID